MRATRRKAKPGEVLFIYGKLGDDNPDHIVMWGGDGATKRHSNVVMHGITGTKFEPDHKNHPGWKIGKSFLKELEDAGFDTTTIEFKIKMKATPGAAEGEN